MMTNTKHCFTDEEKAELGSNPYTFYVSDYSIVFTLAFKQFILREIDKPGMNARIVFQKAGYRPELLPDYRRRAIVRRIRKEAASEQGLQAPKKAPELLRKKKTATQIKELEQRILILEQQIDFLKKSRHLKETGILPLDNTD